MPRQTSKNIKMKRSIFLLKECSVKKTVGIAISIIGFVIFSYWYLTTKYPVYCFEENKIYSDEEILSLALTARENEILFYGGIDAYERKFIELNRNPEEAGRDFNSKDPGCCRVYRGAADVQRNCGDSYSLCVILSFPARKGLPKNYVREGRAYMFNACGVLKDKI